MKRLRLLLSLLVLGLVLAPASGHAQKQRAPAQGPDADGDGVPDASDRCANTARGTRVTRDGCPVSLLPLGQAPAQTGARGVAPAAPAAADSGAAGARKTPRPTPTLAGQPGAAGRDTAGARAPAAPASGAQPPAVPARAPAQAPAAATPLPAAPVPAPAQVAPQAAGGPGVVGVAAPGNAPAGAAAANAAVARPEAMVANQPGPGTFTAGLAIPDYRPGAGAREQYQRRFSQGLNAVIDSLVSVFRGTMGQPLPGAMEPASLTQRERSRWSQCRNLYWDLTSYASAMEVVGDSLPDNAALQRTVSGLDSALGGLDSLSDCDNVASMIEAPARWTPWGQQYESTARRFYRGWYAEVREVNEKHRAFIVALNAVLPASRRLPVPAGMPRNPPYAGAGP